MSNENNKNKEEEAVPISSLNPTEKKLDTGDTGQSKNPNSNPIPIEVAIESVNSTGQNSNPENENQTSTNKTANKDK